MNPAAPRAGEAVEPQTLPHRWWGAHGAAAPGDSLESLVEPDTPAMRSISCAPWCLPRAAETSPHRNLHTGVHRSNQDVPHG